MKSVYVMGRYGSGKTAVCLGLALKLKEEGFKVAYFKPVGGYPELSRKEDPDCVLMKEVLKQATPVHELVLYRRSPYYLTTYEKSEQLLHGVHQRFRAISKGADVVIIEGTTGPFVMTALGLDAPTIAREVGAVALMVNKIENDLSFDRIILYNDYVTSKGVEVLGNIFNNVPRSLLDKTVGVYRPILENRGYRVLGIVPKNVEIAAPRVQEYYDVLGGELLVEDADMDAIVEDVLVGAMNLESAMGYLRRAPNKALITGGDRSDLALAAMETSTSVIILTGGLYPSVQVVARAEEKRVPIILVHYDTYTTIEKLQEVSRKITPSDHKGIELAKANLERNVNWQEIAARLRT